LLTLVGPVVDAQEVTPLTPVIVQTPAPVGATALVGPDTVVVKTIVEPRVAVPAFALTVTVGATELTVVVAPEVGAVEA